MFGTVEILKNREVEGVEETVASLMTKVKSFSEKKILRPEEIKEVGELLRKKEEIIVGVLVRFLYAGHRRHREATLLVLAHPDFDFQALSSEGFVPLREQVVERVFRMAKNDRAKRVRERATVLASKIGGD